MTAMAIIKEKAEIRIGDRVHVKVREHVNWKSVKNGLTPPPFTELRKTVRMGRKICDRKCDKKIPQIPREISLTFFQLTWSLNKLSSQLSAMTQLCTLELTSVKPEFNNFLEGIIQIKIFVKPSIHSYNQSVLQLSRMILWIKHCTYYITTNWRMTWVVFRRWCLDAGPRASCGSSAPSTSWTTCRPGSG